MSHNSIDSLREESARRASERDYSSEAIEVHRQLYEADPADKAAANRLGIALLERAHFQEAELVFTQTLVDDPANAIAQRRLKEVRKRIAAGQDPPERAGVEREEWPEFVEHDASEIRRWFQNGTSNWQRGLLLLAGRAPRRMTYPEIDDALGWSRGKWRSVVGGTRSADGQALRPFHICSPALSRSGEWEAWMDAEQADALNRVSGSNAAT